MKAKMQVIFILIILINFIQIPDNVNSKIPDNNNISYITNGSEVLNISSTVNILSDETLTYQNKLIYYNSSVSPVFFNFGTLILIDCLVIPLESAVDFIFTFGGKIYLENVTIINSVFNNTAKFIDSDGSNITLIDSTFKGFARADIWNADDIYISNCQFNVTEKIYFQTTNNLTIRDSNFDLLTNESTNLFEVRSSQDCRLYNNNFTLPFSTASDLGAWLVAVEIRQSQNVEFIENRVRNAGKVFVAYGSSNLAIINNSLSNDDYVSGSELQIAGGCKDIVIANNTILNLHDSIEIYDHENITVIGNHITTNVLGFYIKPANKTAPTDVRILNNTQIGGSISAQYTHGLVIENNTFIKTDPIHLINSSDVSFKNNQMINSSINNLNTINTTIDGNEIYIVPSFTWLYNTNSSTIMGTNTIHYFEHNNPEITNVQINPANPLDNETINIRVDVTDESIIQNVQFHYKINESSWDALTMIYFSGDTYEITIGPYGNTTNITFYISALDSSYYENVGVNNNNTNYYKIQILVFVEPEPTPTPTPTLTPTPTPSTTPSSTAEGGLTFLVSIVFLISILSLVIFLNRKKQ